MRKMEVTSDEKRVIERRREKLSEVSKLGEDLANKMEYIAQAFREDPTRVRYLTGMADGYGDTSINPDTFKLIVGQVYALCRDIKEGRFKTE